MLLDKRAEVAEYLVEFMNPSLDLLNLRLALLYEGLLKREFLRGQLCLEDLRLTLRGCRTCSPSLFFPTNSRRTQLALCA